MAESSLFAMPNTLHQQQDEMTRIDHRLRENLKGCPTGALRSCVIRGNSGWKESSDRGIVDDANALTSQQNCNQRRKKKRNHLILEGEETQLCPAVKRCRWSVVRNSDRPEIDNTNCNNSDNNNISIIRENEQEEMQRRTNVSKKNNKCRHHHRRRRVRFQLDSVGNVVRTFAMSCPFSQTTAAGESIDLKDKNNKNQEEDAIRDQVKLQPEQAGATQRKPLVRNIKAIRQDVMDCFRHDGDMIGLYANVMLQTYLTCCNSKIDADADEVKENINAGAHRSSVAVNDSVQQQDCDVWNKQACATTTNPASALRTSTTHSHTTATARKTSSSTAMTLIPPDHVAFLGIGRGRSRGLETHVLPALARERKRRRFAHVQQIVLLHAQLCLAAAAAQAAPQSNNHNDTLIEHPKNYRECNPIVPHPASMSSSEVDDDDDDLSSSVSSSSSLCPCSLSSSPQSSLLLDTVATLLRAVSLQSSAPARQFAQIMGAADAADAWTEYNNSLAPPSVLPDSDKNYQTQPQALAPSSFSLPSENQVTMDQLATLAHIPSPSPPPPPVSSDEDSSDDDDEQAAPEHC